MKDVFEDELVNNIVSNYISKLGRINEWEVRSWNNSIQYMYLVLSDCEIPKDSGVTSEFKIPHTSKRVNFLISGSDKDAKQSIFIV